MGDREMNPASRTFHGTVLVRGAVDAVFELFSPLGERAWVPGWNPELLHPQGAGWAEGQIFRTRDQHRDAIWLVTRLDRAGRSVEYHRVEPGRYVARIRVACAAAGEDQTQASVSYAFMALSPEGSEEILAMTGAEYEEKMRRWRRWIGGVTA